MSYEFKKLAEVEVLEELSENAHVIVEDGGVTRRYSAAGVGGTGITTVIMDGNANTLTIGDKVYSVSYTCDGTNTVAETGVAPAISLESLYFNKRTCYVNCGNNLTEIKQALMYTPCFITAMSIPVKDFYTGVLTVSLGGLNQWTRCQESLGEALFIGQVYIFLT